MTTSSSISVNALRIRISPREEHSLTLLTNG
jgi:hypothetical protein